MTIRFKCPHCQKPLSVKDHLAGKKAACPVCKKVIAIPTPVDIESFAAEALADQPAEKTPEPVNTKTIEFTCPQCDEELKLPADLGGKKTPCPKCTNIIKVPLPQDSKPKDWRTTQKGGPSAALANLPEQLSDAWGTEQKGKVSRQAMEDAGALPEPVAKPVGVGGWIRRGFWTCLVAGGVVLLVTMSNRAREVKRENNSLKDALALLPKLAPLHQAEVLRAAGEIHVRNRNVEKARDSFILARSMLGAIPDDPAGSHDHDLLLIQTLFSQAEMGGTEEEALGGRVRERFSWKDGPVQKDMLQTLEALRAPEAAASAVRDLGSKLMDKGKLEVALGLASNLANGKAGQRSLFLTAQVVAILLALKKDDADASPLKLPEAGQPILDTPARVAYTEGAAFKRNYAEALKIASAKGPPAGRLEAYVAGAAVALADAKNQDAAKEALPFIQEGLEVYKKEVFKETDKSPSWTVLELIRLGGRTDAHEEIKSLINKLPVPFKARAQFNLLQARLAKSTSAEPSTLVDDFDDASNPMRAFAWEALARHNARLGAGGTMQIVLEEDDPARLAFIHLGIALGEQDARNKGP